MDEAVFQQDGLARLAAQYPLSPLSFVHGLCAHPLLTLDALADAAPMLPPTSVERRYADNRPGDEFRKLSDPALSIDAHIRSIAANPAWIMLADIRQLPAYRDLIDAIIDPARAMIEAQTGPIRNLTAFIFISTRRAVTPLHFDPEYNLFFQIRGTKDFSTYPPTAPFVDEAVNEKLHVDGDNMLDWNAAQKATGVTHALQSGDGLFVPYKSPHWIEVGDDVSISLSVTWKSDWCLEQENAHRFNARMRTLGLTPAALPVWPQRVPARAIGARVLDRLGLMR